MMNPIRELAFQLITELCFEACGDGDSAIVSDEYKILADDFEKWINEKYLTEFEKTTDENCIVFSRGQENIIFTNNEKILPEWVGNRLVRPWL